MKTVKIILSMLIAAGSFIYNASPCHAQTPWIQKADMHSARKSQCSCVLDGKIYVIGGKDASSTFKSMEVYDPDTDTWDTTKADMAEARCRFSCCVIDGKILAIGGSVKSESDPIISIEEYDPVSDSWSHKADIPRERIGPTAEVVHNKIYVIGGFRDPGNYIPIPEIDVYDLQTEEWTTAADLKTPRWFAASVVVNDKIYVMGGEKRQPWNGLPTVEEYDPATDTWSTKADMITGRKSLAACVVDGMIYVFGGSTSYCSGILSSVEIYDPLMDSWEDRTNMPSILGDPSAVQFNGKVYVSGGSIAACPSNPVKTMYEYNPELESSIVYETITKRPVLFSLSQNYPNPFNPSTTIWYTIPKASEVTLIIYDLLGREITTLVNKTQTPGEYSVLWNGQGQPSGIYICRLRAGDFTETRKLVLQK
jgi:N-acetylneuraminic acid mutarotase